MYCHLIPDMAYHHVYHSLRVTQAMCSTQGKGGYKRCGQQVAVTTRRRPGGWLPASGLCLACACCVRACVCACAHTCMCAHMCVHTLAYMYMFQPEALDKGELNTGADPPFLSDVRGVEPSQTLLAALRRRGPGAASAAAPRRPPFRPRSSFSTSCCFRTFRAAVRCRTTSARHIPAKVHVFTGPTL